MLAKITDRVGVRAYTLAASKARQPPLSMLLVTKKSRGWLVRSQL